MCYRQKWRRVVCSNVGRKRNSGSEKKWKNEKRDRHDPIVSYLGNDL
jgi:hypothetical protein